MLADPIVPGPFALPAVWIEKVVKDGVLSAIYRFLERVTSVDGLRSKNMYSMAIAELRRAALDHYLDPNHIDDVFALAKTNVLFLYACHVKESWLSPWSNRGGAIEQIDGERGIYVRKNPVDSKSKPIQCA